MMNAHRFHSLLGPALVLAWLTPASGLFAVPTAANESPAGGGRADDTQVVSRQIDQLFEQSWQAAGRTAAPLADDATFLRRLMIDLTGATPRIGEIRDFLNDTRPDKRRAMIDGVLARPQHARHLAQVWKKVLLPPDVSDSTAAAFESWLQSQFQDNVGYDELVKHILLAEGTLAQSPEVLYYAALDSKPERLASSTSRVFLGLQIRCAECHDHPQSSWSQDDFWGYAALFAQVRGPATDGGTNELQDVSSGEVVHPETKQPVLPALLDETPMPSDSKLTRRQLLAEWMVSAGNPYFAKAAVNRVWWMMFGRGLVHPVDDLGDHNPATHAEVLELLEKDFVAHGYNLRRTFTILAGTRLYQLSSQPAAGDPGPFTTYTVMPVRSLSAQQVYDSLLQASGRREPLDASASEIVLERQTLVAQLEAPTQQPTEYQGGIPQALALLNGPLVESLTDPATGDLIAALVDSPFLTDQERIENLFLATLSRLPTEQEQTSALKLIEDSLGDTAQALSDILWALLNSSEFIVNR